MKQTGEGEVGFAFGGGLQDVLSQDDAGDIVRFTGVNGQPAVTPQADHHLHRPLDSQAFIQGKCHRPRGHHLPDNFCLEAEDIEDHPLLVRLDSAGFKRQGGDVLQFLGTDIAVGSPLRNEPREGLAHPDDGFESYHHPVDGIGDHRGQSIGEADANGFGKNLGKDEDDEGKYGGKPDDILITVKICGGSACYGCPDGVREGIQGENSSDRFLDISAQILENLGGRMTGPFQHFHLTGGNRIEYSLKDRTEKGDDYSQGNGGYQCLQHEKYAPLSNESETVFTFAGREMRCRPETVVCRQVGHPSPRQIIQYIAAVSPEKLIPDQILS